MGLWLVPDVSTSELTRLLHVLLQLWVARKIADNENGTASNYIAGSEQYVWIYRCFEGTYLSKIYTNYLSLY